MIENAELNWNEQGAPISQRFDDVYFSSDNGLEETRYVFLGGNGLPERFIDHPRPLFVAAETGFGTGLNFLTLWQSFSALHSQQETIGAQRLHFISCEKYPLSTADLTRAHQQWPELAEFAQQLQQQWPAAIPGCHRLLFEDGRITLDLWLGDITELITKFDQSLHGQVDAWFLDGFAPAKNPDMWSQPLFDAMARMARPQSTLATFTAAGFVRRGLQQAGFAMARRKGFGRKREMLVGERGNVEPLSSPHPWYHRPVAQGSEIALIGGGIASACLALALLRRGYQVKLYSADATPAANASGNRQAAVYPLLMAQDPAIAEFFPCAFSFAHRWYQSLSLNSEQQWQGVLQLGWDDKSRNKIVQMLKMALPVELAHQVTAEQASDLAGVALPYGGIFYPQGGWISPRQLTEELLARAVAQGLSCHWQQQLVELDARDNGWQLEFADGSRYQHQNVVLANGDQLNMLSQTRSLPVYPVAGQVSHSPTTPRLRQLKTVLCYEGYLTPLSTKHQTHSIGASYRRNSRDRQLLLSDQQQNHQRLLDCLPECDWGQEIDTDNLDARSGVRCATRDHLPMVGAVPDYQATLQHYGDLARRQSQPDQLPRAPHYPGLFVMGALGSRGLCSAPLLAEILAAQICGEPQPTSARVLQGLQPNRLWIRKLLKGKPLTE